MQTSTMAKPTYR